MKYHSTRDTNNTVTAAQAIVKGLAPDGGLYVPEYFPLISMETIDKLCRMDYHRISEYIMDLFLDGPLSQELDNMAKRAYGLNFDHKDIAPVHFTDEGICILELWHGPTSAFKDMALQMLPHLLTNSIKECGESREVCILVATSGDTGKAALEGFKDVSGTRIIVFYPKNGVSDVQKLQMTTQEGGNVLVCGVDGNFDDTQAGVKAIFADTDFAEKLSERGYVLSSANSINWGRLLPQIAYYFSAYCDYVNFGGLKLGETVNICVPTGNFGNILAAWYAKILGLPIAKLICASNENNVLTDFIATGTYDRNRPFYITTSPSMDILVSSNLERLLYAVSKDPDEVSGYMLQLAQTGKYTVSDKLKNEIITQFAGGWCGQDHAAEVIAELYYEKGYLMDPHTAVGYKVLKDYRMKSGDRTPTILCSTASPFKFCEDVLRAIDVHPNYSGVGLISLLSEKTGIQPPKPLAHLGEKTVRFSDVRAKGEMCDVVEEFLR